jgi:hypothetical protein
VAKPKRSARSAKEEQRQREQEARSDLDQLIDFLKGATRIFQSVCKSRFDTPYGPYADGFSMEQHLLGPFGPIRAKVKELAAETRTAHAGEPDNGSRDDTDK